MYYWTCLNIFSNYHYVSPHNLSPFYHKIGICYKTQYFLVKAQIIQ